MEIRHALKMSGNGSDLERFTYIAELSHENVSGELFSFSAKDGA